MAKQTTLGGLSQRERVILGLALLVALVFVATRGVPLAHEVYAARADSIEGVALDIERERRLEDSAATWIERRRETETALALAEAGLFNGTTAAIVEANIQRALTQHAAASGITVNSTRLAERREAGQWTLVSQEMSFRTDDAAATITFLARLRESLPRLRVAGFTLDRSRNQFTGSITVVGFARVATGERL